MVVPAHEVSHPLDGLVVVIAAFCVTFIVLYVLFHTLRAFVLRYMLHRWLHYSRREGLTLERAERLEHSLVRFYLASTIIDIECDVDDGKAQLCARSFRFEPIFPLGRMRTLYISYVTGSMLVAVNGWIQLRIPKRCYWEVRRLAFQLVTCVAEAIEHQLDSPAAQIPSEELHVPRSSAQTALDDAAPSLVLLPGGKKPTQ